MQELEAPKLELFATLSVQVATPIEIGQVNGGRRRVIPILGGELRGPQVSGRVLEAGADFQLVQPDGVADLDARYVIQLDDGTNVFVANRAMRRASLEVTEKLVRGEAVDPALVYFRCMPRFEVTEGRWRWLAESLFVGTGVRRPDTVEMAFYRLM
ncbi:MAG: DUF3237 domain-containing protein [Ideonella sp.]